MTRYRGPRVKIVRRLGLLQGFTNKFPGFRKFSPGQHGKDTNLRKRRLSLSDDYSARLIEKQKLRLTYGVTERQLVSYYRKAKKSAEATGLVLLELLESRLDCIVYRIGFASTIAEARQLVNHRHIEVNGKIINIPSFFCHIGDQIRVKKNSKKKASIFQHLDSLNKDRELVVERIKQVIKKTKKQFLLRIPKSLLPTHLEFDTKKNEAKMIGRVKRSNVGLSVKELKVVEYYSR